MEMIVANHRGSWPLRVSAAERAKARAVLARVGGERLLEEPLRALSGGELQRAFLARAIVNEPELLLLDEPTASLDPDTADRMRGYLTAYRQRAGATILLASHNMLEVERLCGDVIMMRAGKIVDRGTPAELLARFGRANLEEVFLDIARDRPRAESLP